MGAILEKEVLGQELVEIKKSNAIALFRDGSDVKIYSARRGNAAPVAQEVA